MPKTKKKAEYTAVNVSRIPELLIHDEGQGFSLVGVTSGGDSKNYPCTVELYRAVESDNVHRNYRVNFILHINKSTELVERITTTPKTEYVAYQVEYAEDINLPDKAVFKEPI